MRITRNVSFILLLVVLAIGAQLEAYPIVGDPSCDDPNADQVSFVAEEGSCAEEEGECSAACYECYNMIPKDVDINECNAGEFFHFVTCTCYFIK